jgi:hypothetical protein
LDFRKKFLYATTYRVHMPHLAPYVVRDVLGYPPPPMHGATKRAPNHLAEMETVESARRKAAEKEIGESSSGDR